MERKKKIKILIMAKKKTTKSEAPIQETPIQETALQETPIQEALIQEAPIQEAPIQEAPIQEAPIQEAPIQEAPIQEAPIQEAPIQEIEEVIDLTKIIGKNATKEPQGQTNASGGGTIPVSLSNYVTGALLLILLDRFFAPLMSWMCRKFMKMNIDKPINLTESEIEQLEPIADKLVEDITVNMTPLQALLTIMPIMYGSKIMELKLEQQFESRTSKIKIKPPKPATGKRGRPRKK